MTCSGTVFTQYITCCEFFYSKCPCWGDNICSIGNCLSFIFENWTNIDNIWYLGVYTEIWQANLILIRLDIMQSLCLLHKAGMKLYFSKTIAKKLYIAKNTDLINSYNSYLKHLQCSLDLTSYNKIVCNTDRSNYGMCCTVVLYCCVANCAQTYVCVCNKWRSREM
jgi:hypothetical protein